MGPVTTTRLTFTTVALIPCTVAGRRHTGSELCTVPTAARTAWVVLRMDPMAEQDLPPGITREPDHMAVVRARKATGADGPPPVDTIHGPAEPRLLVKDTILTRNGELQPQRVATSGRKPVM